MPALLSEAFRDDQSNSVNRVNRVNHVNRVNNNPSEHYTNEQQSLVKHAKCCEECKKTIIDIVLKEENITLKKKIAQLEKIQESFTNRKSPTDSIMEFVDDYPLLALLICIVGIDVFYKFMKK